MPRMILCDTETTGLQRNDKTGEDLTKHHLILEIALLAIDMPSMTEVEAWSTPIRWAQHQITERCDDLVLKMHTKNGLISEIVADGRSRLARRAGGLPIEAEAEQEAIAFLQRNTTPGEKPELCGANPDFERTFFSTRMPKLQNAFHYRNFDTNTFWLTRKFFGDWDGVKEQQPHRALPDCRREFQALIDHFTWCGQVLRGER